MTKTPTSKGGPRTEAGKAASSRNAVKHGVWAKWFDSEEQATYDAVIEQLSAQYGHLGFNAKLMIERAAVATVKLKRLQRVEDALYERARLVRTHNESQAHPNSVASMLPAGEESRERALAVATGSAFPDTASLDTLARYETTLERQLFRWLEALQVLRDDAPAASNAALPSSKARLSVVPRVPLVPAAPKMISRE
jgi:hypothetical protein